MGVKIHYAKIVTLCLIHALPIFAAPFLNARVFLLTTMKTIPRLLLAMTLSASSIATAATDGIGCSGKIESLTIHGPDGVFLQLTNMNTVVKICDLGKTVGTSYAVSPAQCKAVYSALLFAFSTDRTMSILFDNVVTGTNCSNFAAWELATARNVGFARQN